MFQEDGEKQNEQNMCGLTRKMLKGQIVFLDVAELALMSPGGILFLYSDGVYDGSDKKERQPLENVMREHNLLPPKDICNALLEYALKRDDRLRQIGEEDRIDDKTVFTIKRNLTFAPVSGCQTGTARRQPHSPQAPFGLSQGRVCLFISGIVFQNAFQCLNAGRGIASHLVKICQSQVRGRVVGVGFDGFVVEMPGRRHVSLSEPNLRQTSSNLYRCRPRVNCFLQRLGCLRWRLRVSHQ